MLLDPVLCVISKGELRKIILHVAAICANIIFLDHNMEITFGHATNSTTFVFIYVFNDIRIFLTKHKLL